MNRECNVTKRVMTHNGLRYCPVPYQTGYGSRQWRAGAPS